MRRAFLVLGMHRSGTSALAGLIVRLGIDGPRTLMPPNEFNPLGYWESEPIVEFHDRLLRDAGTSWDGWTPLDAFDPRPYTGDLSRILSAEFGQAPSFVVKDPRMCRFVPFWLNALAENGIAPAVVIIVRDPVDVSRSLAARDQMPPDFGLLMWLRHMLDAEQWTRDMPRSIVGYRELLADWRSTADRIGRDLGVSWPATPNEEAIVQFLKPDLCHHAAEPHDLHARPPIDRWSSTVRDAFDHLLGRRSASVAETLLALDTIRRELDDAGAAFGWIDESVRSQGRFQFEWADRDRRALQSQVVALQGQVVALDADRSKLREEKSRLEARVDGAERRAGSLDVELTRAHEALVQAREDVAALQTQHADLAAHNERLQGAQAQLSTELASALHRIDALLSSGSWRITAPLRALLRLARRVSGRGSVNIAV